MVSPASQAAYNPLMGIIGLAPNNIGYGSGVSLLTKLGGSFSY